jgi:membrane protein YqaA with SNARE-associated domain
MDFLLEFGYVGLFLAAFLAATVLPLGSEVVFASLIFAGWDVWTCVIVATIGNTLGGITSYWIGRLGKIEWMEKYLKIKKEKIDKFEKRMYNRGDWLALFSFVPGIGDVIVVACGYFRCNFWGTTLFMTIGKFGRYVAWMYTQGLIMK